jgi:hypothetical protein
MVRVTAVSKRETKAAEKRRTPKKNEPFLECGAFPPLLFFGCCKVSLYPFGTKAAMTYFLNFP